MTCAERPGPAQSSRHASATVPRCAIICEWSSGFWVRSRSSTRPGRRRLGGAKQRTLLGLLLVHAGQVVSSDRLIDALWGERPPPTAPTSLRNLVTQLRKVVGPGVIATRAPGYVLEVAPEQIDLTRFELLVAEAQSAEPAERAHALRDALALWRGPALADLAFESALAPEIARLEELRLEALEARIDADLMLGAGPNLVPELEKLVAQHPYREQLRGQLMLALYRSGRQVEALDAYLEARHALVNEVGVDPSEELQRLHGQILRQEPALKPGTAAVTLPRQPTPFLGRERELGDVLRLLGRDEVRLLTLTGAGGSGKTRLALQAAASQADRHPDGVFWVPLAPLGDPGHVVDAIVAAVGPLDGLTEKRLLLVVDNFEHVLPASNVLSEMIAANPHVRVLVTSREPLRLAAEYEYAVPTMDEQDAVRLFAERAGGHDDDKNVRGDLPPAGLSSAGDRARGGANQAAGYRRAARATLGSTAAAHTRTARRRRPAPSARNCDRVELRPARGGRAAAVRTTRDLRRRLDDRRGRGGVRRRTRHAPVAYRQEPHPPPHRALRDARDSPRVRRRTPRRVRCGRRATTASRGPLHAPVRAAENGCDDAGVDEGVRG